MKARNLKISVVFGLATLATLVLARCTIIPAFLVQTDPPHTPGPGDTLYYQVGVTPTPTADMQVAISTNDAGSFSSLPSSVTVYAGHSTANFSATLSQNPSNSFWITATANGTSTSCQSMSDAHPGGK